MKTKIIKASPKVVLVADELKRVRSGAIMLSEGLASTLGRMNDSLWETISEEHGLSRESILSYNHEEGEFTIKEPEPDTSKS